MQEFKKGWKKVRFGDVIISNPKISIRKGEKHNFIEMQSINEGCYRKVKNIDYKEYKGGTKFEDGDILFSRITPCLQNGKIAQVNGIDIGFGSTEYFIFRNIEGVTDNKFLFYRLIEKGVRDIAEKSMVGASGRQRANILSIQDLEISLPPIPTQKKIASILSKYDDLIENNNKRIKVLEETAQAIYEEWFVNYNFPGSENVEMVDSGNDDFGMIPEGWEVVKFGNFYNVKYGKTLSKTKIKDFGTYPVYGAGGIIGFYDEKNIDKKVSLVTCRGNGSSTVWRTLEDNTFVTNNSFIVTSGNIDFPFILEHLKGCNLKSAVSGSAQPQLTIDGVKDLLILVPKIKIINNYNSFVDNIFNESDNLVKQNQNLKETRDLLIPRLVNGELEVENLDVK